MGRSSNSTNWSINLNIIATYAHPDDETRFLSGTLAMLAGKGIRTNFLIATRGEGTKMIEDILGFIFRRL
jgi:LmbE family N-acetylglucosaminyl deacetylase